MKHWSWSCKINDKSSKNYEISPNLNNGFVVLRKRKVLDDVPGNMFSFGRAWHPTCWESKAMCSLPSLAWKSSHVAQPELLFVAAADTQRITLGTQNLFPDTEVHQGAESYQDSFSIGFFRHYQSLEGKVFSAFCHCIWREHQNCFGISEYLISHSAVSHF